MVAMVALVVLRRPIVALVQRLISSESGKAKVGPIEIELGKLAEEGKKVVADLNRLSVLMAETRLLELEITDGMFSRVFRPDQSERMKKHIEELRSLTQKQK